MPGSLASQSLTPRRLNLSDLPKAWAMCRQDGDRSKDDLPAAHEWVDIDRASTAAAALRQAGQWSLDSTPQDFDASVWWFKVQFDSLEPVEHSVPDSVLVFEGLATVCQVWLNGHAMLDSSNMFMPRTVAVNDDIQPVGNVLLFRFDALQNQLRLKRPRPRWRTPMVANQHLRWVRTTLLGRTPGWSPPAAPVGVWRPVWLEHRQTGHLIRSALKPRVVGGQGMLQVDCWFQQALPASYQVTVFVEGPQQRFHMDMQATTEPGHLQATLNLPQVSLWWPHTHGTPLLYQVTLTVTSPAQAMASQLLGRVGFRTVSLDESQGRFAVQVNQTPVFCRGACWMPLDVVSLNASEAAYRQAIAQARDAGMNMLRLAGSTVYEDRVFFDLCDELGVMVWQDLMFSNMDYPADDPDFVRSAEAEVAQQLTRLQPHPCVVVVCGNSEAEQQAAMWGAPREAWSAPLFHHTLAAQAQTLLGTALYWPSSAHGGAFPHQASAGTCSYYGVGAYKRELGDALGSQVAFATECLAFANIPPASTLRRAPAGEAPQVHSAAWKARVYRDLSVGWDFDDVREHYVERLLGLRPDELRAVDPARHLTLGRAVAAEVVGRTMAAWRTTQSPCGGALVWFLRDLWAGAGCGLVDDQGTPKSVLHALSRVQQPLLAVIEDRGLNGLYLHLVNETASAIAGKVELVMYQHGDTVVARHTRDLHMAPRSRCEWPMIDWLEGFMDLTWAYRFGPAAMDLVVANWQDQEGGQLGQALHFSPQQMVQFNGPPGLTGLAVRLADGCVDVQLETRAAAYGVHFDSRGWQPSDEFFHLPPGSRKTVRFSPLAAGQTHWHATVSALNARQASTVALKALAN